MALHPRQRALIERMAQFPYPTMAQAARDLEIPIDTAKKWARRPEFRGALDAACDEDEREVRANLDQRIKALGDAAVAAKIKGLQAKSEHVRHLESSYVLDRILGKPREHHETTATLNIVTEIEKLLDRPVPLDAKPADLS